MAIFVIVTCEQCGEEYMEESDKRIKTCPSCRSETVEPEIPLDFWTGE